MHVLIPRISVFLRWVVNSQLAAKGTTTGISAFDRSRTIQVLTDPETKPVDLIRPGHIFPLKTHPGSLSNFVNLSTENNLPSGSIC